MTGKSEQSPEAGNCLVLGKTKDNFYVGFRSTKTKKLVGQTLADLVELGLTADNMNGVLLDSNKNVTVVRLSRSEFETGSDDVTPTQQFEHSFAVDIAQKIGGFVASKGVEPVNESIDQKFESILAAGSAVTIENMRKEMEELT